MLVNFGRSFCIDVASEPFLAPPAACHWKFYWTSEDPKYGGKGIYPLLNDKTWQVTGRCLIILTSEANE